MARTLRAPPSALLFWEEPMNQTPDASNPKENRTGISDSERRQRAQEEYDRSIAYNKHCTTIQFGQISVFLAAMTVCMVFFYGDHPPAEPLLTFGKLGTAFIALCLWIMSESHAYMSGRFFRRAAQLEIELGYQGLSTMPGMPEYRYGPAKWALRAVYCLFSLFWLVAFIVAVLK